MLKSFQLVREEKPRHDDSWPDMEQSTNDAQDENVSRVHSRQNMSTLPSLKDNYKA
jgi:hypothetical protein